MISILNFSKQAIIIGVVFSSFVIMTTPLTFAQDSLPTRPGQETSGQTSQPTTGVAPSVSLESPLKDIGSIEGLLEALLNIIIILMIPVIVFFIILAGFKYVTARGNASQVEDATRSLTYAIIGGVLILGAVALSQIIANVVQSF